MVYVSSQCLPVMPICLSILQSVCTQDTLLCLWPHQSLEGLLLPPDMPIGAANSTFPCPPQVRLTACPTGVVPTGACLASIRFGYYPQISLGPASAISCTGAGGAGRWRPCRGSGALACVELLPATCRAPSAWISFFLPVYLLGNGSYRD